MPPPPRPHQTAPRLVLIAIELMVLVACISCGSRAPLPQGAQPLVAKWHSGNGLGSFQLELKSNGKYVLEANQCLGDSGHACGAWQLSNNAVVLQARWQYGDAKEIKTLQVSTNDGAIYLIKTDKLCQQDFAARGPTRYTAFKKDAYW